MSMGPWALLLTCQKLLDFPELGLDSAYLLCSRPGFLAPFSTLLSCSVHDSASCSATHSGYFSVLNSASFSILNWGPWSSSHTGFILIPVSLPFLESFA